MTLSPAAVSVRGLRKTFARPAVAGIDLTINAGEFYGLLGPNGAGKTTTLRMIAGLLMPDFGSTEVRSAESGGIQKPRNSCR